MSNEINIEKICRFETPVTIMVAGSSKVGKSSWVARVIEQSAYLFVHRPKKIIWCYGAGCFQPELANRLKKSIKNIVFQEGFPREKVASGNLFKKGDKGILVLDDLMMDVANEPIFAKLFLQYSHHQDFRLEQKFFLFFLKK